MFQSKLYIDLPSRETLRDRTVGEWFTSLFGSRPDLRSGREVMTISAYAVLEGLVQGLDSSGMNNVISLIVDNKTIFLDTQEEPDDLDAMHAVATRSGALNRRFRELHLALSHREEGLHIILDILLRPHVLVGNEEMVITLSARMEELQHQRKESALRYRSRLTKFAEDKGNIEDARESLDRITARLASGLQETLPGARFRSESSQMRLVRPSKKQIGRMRGLRFDGSHAPRYRSAPARYHGGTFYDPFYHYYYDPFYDFALLVFVGLAIEYTWHMDYLYFVDPMGDMLGYAHELDFEVFADDWDGYDVLNFNDDGDFYFDDSIPAYDYDDSYEDYASYDEAWGLEPLEVYNPDEGGFVEADWDSDPIDYSSFADEDTSYYDTDEASYGDEYDDGVYQDDGYDRAYADDGGYRDEGYSPAGGDEGGGWGSGDSVQDDEDVYNASMDDWDDDDGGGSWDDDDSWDSNDDW